MTNYRGFQDLAKVLHTRYGAEPESTGIVEAAIWAAEYLIEASGFAKEDARAQLTAYNRYRSRIGKVLSYPSYGSPLF